MLSPVDVVSSWRLSPLKMVMGARKSTLLFCLAVVALTALITAAAASPKMLA
jgi:hypothetical protein